MPDECMQARINTWSPLGAKYGTMREVRNRADRGWMRRVTLQAVVPGLLAK